MHRQSCAVSPWNITISNQLIFPSISTINDAMSRIETFPNPCISFNQLERLSNSTCTMSLRYLYRSSSLIVDRSRRHCGVEQVENAMSIWFQSWQNQSNLHAIFHASHNHSRLYFNHLLAKFMKRANIHRFTSHACLRTTSPHLTMIPTWLVWISQMCSSWLRLCHLVLSSMLTSLLVACQVWPCILFISWFASFPCLSLCSSARSCRCNWRCYWCLPNLEHQWCRQRQYWLLTCEIPCSAASSIELTSHSSVTTITASCRIFRPHNPSIP